MNGLRKSFLILLLPLVAFTAHKFYVSVTNISYSDKDNALQITTRIFIDDFEKVLHERYDLKANLATDEELEVADAYIEKYLNAKFAVKLNGEHAAYTFLGKKYDNDVMICYLELSKIEVSKLTSIEVQNEILTDLFDEQQNVVHFRVNDLKKSFVLLKGNNKGMLNL